jgi:hypothetical protein
MKALLSAVQSGDATASKSAADTLIKEIKNASALQNTTDAYYPVVGRGVNMRIPALALLIAAVPAAAQNTPLRHRARYTLKA